MFGKTSFNKTRFNRSGTVTALYCTVRSEYGTEASSLHAYVEIPGPTMYSEFNTIADSLKFMVPLAATQIDGEFSFDPDRLGAKVPLGRVQTEGEFELTAGTLRNDTSDEIVLEGVNLAPGHSLIIDTDTLDVYIDGISNVDVWVTGSTFFQLQNGNNAIRFYDNKSSRQLGVTILWADRYL